MIIEEYILVTVILIAIFIAFCTILDGSAFYKSVSINELIEQVVKNAYILEFLGFQRVVIETDKGIYILGGRSKGVENKIITIAGSLDDIKLERIISVEISSFRPFEPSDLIIQSRLKIRSKHNQVLIMFGTSELASSSFEKAFKNVINLDKVCTFPKLGKRTVRKNI